MVSEFGILHAYDSVIFVYLNRDSLKYLALGLILQRMIAWKDCGQMLGVQV